MSRTLLISGASRGIGRALAEHFLELGWNVAGCSRGVATIEHAAYRHFVADVSDEAAVVPVVRAGAREFGTLDALVNNAGAASMNHLLTTPLSGARRIIETNVIGTLLFLREAAKIMVRQKNGRIVNLTTVAVPLDLEGEAVYAASKAAVESLTRIAAREFGPFGICVNAVGPTPIPTDLTRAVPAAKLESLAARQALKRPGEMRDVINVIEFFLSEKSDFITGQVIYLGGIA